MTTTGMVPPRTALAVLAGEHHDSGSASAQRLLSAELSANLADELDRFPEMTRAAVVREATAAAGELLDTSLAGLLVAGWRIHHDLTISARRTLKAAGSKELVELTEHRITTIQRPSVTILVDGRPVTTVHFALCVVFDVSAILAVVTAGRLVALHTGRCDVTVTLAVEETDVLTRDAHLDLPGVISIGPGIRLLPEQDYPPEPGHPEAEGP